MGTNSNVKEKYPGIVVVTDIAGPNLNESLTKSFQEFPVFSEHRMEKAVIEESDFFLTPTNAQRLTEARGYDAGYERKDLL